MTSEPSKSGCCGITRKAKDRKATKVATGNSPVVKDHLDNAAIEALKGRGYVVDHTFGNIKLAIMATVCAIALVAQFPPWSYPRTHNPSTDPTHRLRLGICCAIYFVFSTVFQMFVSFYEKVRCLARSCVAAATVPCPCALRAAQRSGGCAPTMQHRPSMHAKCVPPLTHPPSARAPRASHARMPL